MLCTLQWMREHYIMPFIRHQQGNALVETHAVRIPQDGLFTEDSTPPMSCNQPVMVTTVADTTPRATRRSNLVCSSCNQTSLQGLCYYRCSQCPSSDLCEQCYNAPGQHDQTHSFERIRDSTTCSEPEPSAAQVEALTDINSLVPADVLMAIALPVDDASPDDMIVFASAAYLIQ
jgi:hypothetical protein